MLRFLNWPRRLIWKMKYGSLNWPRRLIWKMKYGRLAMSDCPVPGEGLEHVWVGNPLMTCTACGFTIPSKPD